jgi:hypothetical protein
MRKSTTGRKPKKRKKKLQHPTPLPIILILAMIVCLLSTMIAVMQASAGFADKLPVTLHSLLFADYSADPRGFKLPVVRFNLIEEVIRDEQSDQSEQDSVERFATLQAGLKTPVPTVTPAFPQTPTTPTATQPQPTSTPDYTEPPPSPSPTNLPTQTASVVPTEMLPSPTFNPWYPTATSRPANPTKKPDKPDPTDPPPPPPTDPPPPTNPPPPPPTKPPPPPDPYPAPYP